MSPRRASAAALALAAALCRSLPAEAAPRRSAAAPPAPAAASAGAARGPEAPGPTDPGSDSWVRVAVIAASRRGLPDDKPLRFAYQDGEKLERLLATVGQVEPENLFSLRAEDRESLRQGAARAGARVDALKRAGRRVFLQFYYTGHGAARNFHLQDGPLPFDAVREALGGDRADARVYVLDVCYGASFFTAKGFRTAPPLQLQLDLDKSARGEVLISSSASDEQAYEVRTLGGSIFTSHWIMALRGAGDRNRDGQVTLFEAYNYAYDRTSGYSAETLARPQHPSFQMDFTGARDVQLAKLIRAGTGIHFRGCPAGNYQVLDLGRGHPIGELRVPEGEEFTLALDQGRYRVQYRPARGAALSADVDLPAAGMTPLPFAAFAPVVVQAGGAKGPEAPAGLPGAAPARAAKQPEGAHFTFGTALRQAWFRESGPGWSGSLPEADGWFGIAQGLRPPARRPDLAFEVAWSPGGPWHAGLRAGFSESDRVIAGRGTEYLPSLPDTSRARYPVLSEWRWSLRDIHYGAYLGRTWWPARAHRLGLDLGAAAATRSASGDRTLTRTLYGTTARSSAGFESQGWRLETGLDWAWFPGARGARPGFGVGLRAVPYWQALDPESGDAGPGAKSREAGVALGATLFLGTPRSPARRLP